jgi:hypothetical protein
LDADWDFDVQGRRQKRARDKVWHIARALHADPDAVYDTLAGLAGEEPDLAPDVAAAEAAGVFDERADVNVFHHGYSPLLLACSRRSTDVACLLLAHGADPTVHARAGNNDYGQTPAELLGSVESARALDLAHIGYKLLVEAYTQPLPPVARDAVLAFLFAAPAAAARSSYAAITSLALRPNWLCNRRLASVARTPWGPRCDTLVLAPTAGAAFAAARALGAAVADAAPGAASWADGALYSPPPLGEAVAERALAELRTALRRRGFVTNTAAEQDVPDLDAAALAAVATAAAAAGAGVGTVPTVVAPEFAAPKRGPSAVALAAAVARVETSEHARAARRAALVAAGDALGGAAVFALAHALVTHTAWTIVHQARELGVRVALRAAAAVGRRVPGPPPERAGVALHRVTLAPAAAARARAFHPRAIAGTDAGPSTGSAGASTDSDAGRAPVWVSAVVPVLSVPFPTLRPIIVADAGADADADAGTDAGAGMGTDPDADAAVEARRAQVGSLVCVPAAEALSWLKRRRRARGLPPASALALVACAADRCFGSAGAAGRACTAAERDCGSAPSAATAAAASALVFPAVRSTWAGAAAAAGARAWAGETGDFDDDAEAEILAEGSDDAAARAELHLLGPSAAESAADLRRSRARATGGWLDAALRASLSGAAAYYDRFGNAFSPRQPAPSPQLAALFETVVHASALRCAAYGPELAALGTAVCPASGPAVAADADTKADAGAAAEADAANTGTDRDGAGGDNEDPEEALAGAVVLAMARLHVAAGGAGAADAAIQQQRTRMPDLAAVPTRGTLSAACEDWFSGPGARELAGALAAGGPLALARATLVCVEAAVQDVVIALDVDKDGAVAKEEFGVCWNHFVRGNAVRRGELGLPGRDWSELHGALTRSQAEERAECRVE